MISKQKLQSTFGILSLVIGIFNIIFSIVTFLALYSLIFYHLEFLGYSEVNILAVADRIDFISKLVGILLGVIALFEKKKKAVAIVGICINGVTLLWTIALIAGLII